MSTRAITDSVVTLERMMSHGIFDAEIIASELRTKGWKFVDDSTVIQRREIDGIETNLGGAYSVKTPEGNEGYIDWFNENGVKFWTGNAGYFIEGKAPQRMFLAWVFADQLGRIVLGKGFDETGDPPGTVFENVYLSMKSEQEPDLTTPLESATLPKSDTETPTREGK